MTDYRNTPEENAGPALHTETPALPGLTLIELRPMSDAIHQTYRNFVLNKVNDHCVRMAVMQGEYRWHFHPRSDEFFLTLEGRLEIDLADGRTILLNPGEAFTIPANTVHRTRASVRTVNLCFERGDAYTDVEFVEGR
jgi:mannose-6-phosphate isomerase-like protein (cupin superfamily)